MMEKPEEEEDSDCESTPSKTKSVVPFQAVGSALEEAKLMLAEI